MKYMLIAGEASGDLHASRLIKELRERDSEAEFIFIGGDLMAKAASTEPFLHYRELNVMGFSEVIRKLPAIFSTLREAKRKLVEFRPDALILVDYPSFNLRMAKFAHKKGIRTDWYISPKVWAWKAWRVKKIKKYVSFMYSILPFETDFYEGYGYDRIEYVGNPSVEETDYSLSHLPSQQHFLERNGLGADKPIIALLPGSRKGEIRCNLPVMMEAAKHFKDFRIVVGAAPSIPEKFYREVARDPGLTLVFGATTALLKYSVASLVTSGTATLETALIGTPQVVCYRSNGSKLTYKIMRKLVKVDYVALPNLIVNSRIIPEMLLHECTPANLIRELTPLLQTSPIRDRQLQGYRQMRKKLGSGIAPANTARLIVEQLQASRQSQPSDIEEHAQDGGRGEE